MSARLAAFSIVLVVLALAGPAFPAADLMPDGGMEQTTGWHGAPIGSSTVPRTIEISTLEKRSGESSLHIVIARGPQEWPAAKSPAFATETGKTYRVRFWAKVARGAASVQMRNGANNDYVVFFTDQILAPTWTEYTAVYNERNGGDGAALLFFAVGDIVDLYVDDVSITEMDVSKDAILAGWKKASPGNAYVCWQKTSPWDSLQALPEAPEAPKECRAIRLAMGRNEYESASFVLTNLTDDPREFSVSIGPSALRVVLRQAVWITSFAGSKVNDALPLLDGKLVVPSGESREVWLTVNSRAVEPGEYRTTITVSSPGLPERAIALVAKVYPVTLPDDRPIYCYYWDYVVPTWITPDKANALMLDLKDHYVNVAIAHPWSTPRLQLDAGGKLLRDYAELDKALEAYKTLDPDMIVFNWGAENYIETPGGNMAAVKFMSDEWKSLFREWLTGWVEHMKELGYGYERYAMYPYDESLRPAVCDMVKLTKQVDPKVQVFVNNTGSTSEEVANIAPYVDIWCPYLYDYLNNPPYDRNRETKEVAAQLLKKSQRLFWTYANPPGNTPEEAPPYRDYRLAPWKSWNAGTMGFGYWIYDYKTHWNSYKSEDGPNWAVVYFSDAPDAPAGLSKKEIVVTSKRWEATREGIEDCVYLQMLKTAVGAGAAEKNAAALKTARDLLDNAPRRVLAAEDNSSLADDAKEAVLAALSALQTGN